MASGQTMPLSSWFCSMAGRRDAAHPDPVAAHLEGAGPAALVEAHRVHRFAVLAAELEYVADLDPAADGDDPPAVRARIVLDGIAKVGGRGTREVAPPVDAGEVGLVTVRPADEVRGGGRPMVRDDRRPEPDRPDRTRACAGRLAYRFRRCEGDRGPDPLDTARLDQVELMVAAKDEPDRAVVALHEEGLEAPHGRHAEELAHVLDGAHVRGLHLAHRLRRGAGCGRRRGGGELQVRRVGPLVVERDIVLAGLREHVELLGAAAPDCPRIRLHHPEVEARAGEDAPVGIAHRLVAPAAPRLVEVEGVGVLHDEFPRPHNAETWAARSSRNLVWIW